MPELIIGRKAIADYIGITPGKLDHLMPELKAAGLIVRVKLGRPWRWRIAMSRSAFAAWLALKASKGETI